MARRFNLGCLVALLPHDLRPRALAELTEADPDFFFMGHDHARVVTDSAVADGTPLVRSALAGVVRDAQAQRRLLALQDLEIDTSLAGNPHLAYEVESDLRRRRPDLVVTVCVYQPDHHRRALLSDDPVLAAAALLDRREARWGSPIPPTVWATAWRTIRIHHGVSRVREVLAALPTDRRLDEATLEIAEACAQPDPEPYLTSAEDRLTGTGALLRRLREVRTHQDLGVGRAILSEPYRIDWNLVTAAALGHRLPRMAAQMLAQHSYPAPASYVLRTGRPAPPNRVADSSEPAAAPPADPTAHPPESVPPPRNHRRTPLKPGPLGEGNPVTTLSTTAIGKDLTIFHVCDAIELGLINAETAAELARPANAVSCYAGQESAFYAGTRDPGGGTAAFHNAVIDRVAQVMTAAPAVPGFWVRIAMMIRSFEGTLPELLHAAARRA